MKTSTAQTTTPSATPAGEKPVSQRAHSFPKNQPPQLQNPNKPMNLTKLLAVLCAVLAFSLSPTHAADIYWTNTLGGNWGDAPNWSPNQVPGASDDAFLTAVGTYTVVAASQSISNLIVGASFGMQTLVVDTFALVGLNVYGSAVFATNTVLETTETIFATSGIGGPGQTTIHGVMNWRSGSIGAGSVTVAPEGTMNLTGLYSKALYGGLTNAGRLFWTGNGNIALGGGARIVNLAGGVFDVLNDQTIHWPGFGGPNFYNAGLFRKSGGSGATTFDVVTFFNTGTVDVRTGTLRFSNYGLIQSAGSTLLNGGNLSFGAPFAGSMQILGGLLGGSGQVEANGASVTVASQISPGLSAGRLEIQGNYTQTASGSYRAELGGTTAGTNYDQVLVASNAQLAGSVQVCSLNGFVPALGDQFEIMRFASMSGSVTFHGLNIANGVRLEPVISPTNIVLVATNAPFDAVGIYWTNTLGGSWSDAVNWSPNQVPGPTDQAFIIQDGTYTVTMYGASVSNLSVGASCGTQTVVVPGLGFCDSCNARFYGESFFASNTVLNVAGGFNSAVLAGAGLLNIHGQMNLTGDNVIGEAVVIVIGSNAVLNFAGYSHYMLGVITNAGRINWAGRVSVFAAGEIVSGGNARIHNLNGAVFDAQNDAAMFSGLRFFNAGTLRKSAGTGVTGIGAALINSGNIEVESGTLSLASPPFRQRSGALLLKGGNVASPNFELLQVSGGLLGGAGKVLCNLTLSGQLSPGLSAGRVEVQGNYTQRSPGAYNCEIGGTIAGTNYDQVVVTGAAALAGVINIVPINGFTPAAGDQFEIMKFATMSGSVTFHGLDVSDGIQLQPVISATNLVLVAASVQPSASPRLNVARNGTDLWAWWPEGYGSFQLQSATKLTAPIQWSPVSLTEPNRAILPPTGPATFFRMISP